MASRDTGQKTAIDRLIRTTGRAVIATSGEGQMALEGYKEHGVFTFSLLEGLDGSVDTNHTGQVTLLDLATHVSKRVPEITQKRWRYEQFPMLGLKGIDFPLGLVKTRR
ncbi:hypothetical protein CCP3SC1_190024 [Gammaproteobacteria bacterium]